MYINKNYLVIFLLISNFFKKFKQKNSMINNYNTTIKSIKIIFYRK